MRHRRIEAEILLRFAFEVYEMQMTIDNHFWHEYRAGADSWKTPWVHSLRREEECAFMEIWGAWEDVLCAGVLEDPSGPVTKRSA